jgi:hypothetical protein
MGIIKNYQSKGNCKVTFSFPLSEASGAKTIQVLGDFNNWDSKSAPKLKKNKDEFSTSFELLSGNTYQFRYLLDGTKWENDFGADGYIQSPYPGISNSVLILSTEPATALKPTKIAVSKVEQTVKAEKAVSVKSVKTTTEKVVKKPTVKAEKVAVSVKEIKTSTAKTPKIQANKTAKATGVKK